MTTLEIAGKKCHFLNCDPEVERKADKITEKQLMVVCTSSRIEGNMNKVEQYAHTIANKAVVMSFEAEDWDAEFSPWEADAPRYFAGRGTETLAWLKEALIPYLRSGIPGMTQLHITGYSLAGLFALWAACETELFTGAAACSASLWYPGWQEYAERKAGIPLVYLSLGGKEPKTRDPLMATIGEAYELQKQRLQADPTVEKVFFEWNPGGHFADSEKRLIKGMEWLLKNA